VTATPPPSGARTILRVDSGVDHGASVSRVLADRLVERLVGAGDVVVHRDVSLGLPFVDRDWHAAVFAGADPSPLALSEELIEELLRADEVVLVAPVYNLGVPAPLKCWIDQVVRVDRTYRVTEKGSVGLLTARRAWIVTASGGTPIGSAVDFNTPYLRTILTFIGIRDVRVIAADSVRLRGDEAIARAHQTMATELGEAAGAEP
jgi:FMN-dependent NADH-azoreductase